MNNLNEQFSFSKKCVESHGSAGRIMVSMKILYSPADALTHPVLQHHLNKCGAQPTAEAAVCVHRSGVETTHTQTPVSSSSYHLPVTTRQTGPQSRAHSPFQYTFETTRTRGGPESGCTWSPGCKCMRMWLRNSV